MFCICFALPASFWLSHRLCLSFHGNSALASVLSVFQDDALSRRIGLKAANFFPKHENPHLQHHPSFCAKEAPSLHHAITPIV